MDIHMLNSLLAGAFGALASCTVKLVLQDSSSSLESNVKQYETLPNNLKGQFDVEIPLDSYNSFFQSGNVAILYSFTSGFQIRLYCNGTKPGFKLYNHSSKDICVW
jgi:hypothetical protein